MGVWEIAVAERIDHDKLRSTLSLGDEHILYNGHR
jgi:hypothetical protein